MSEISSSEYQDVVLKGGSVKQYRALPSPLFLHSRGLTPSSSTSQPRSFRAYHSFLNSTWPFPTQVRSDVKKWRSSGGLAVLFFFSLSPTLQPSTFLISSSNHWPVLSSRASFLSVASFHPPPARVTSTPRGRTGRATPPGPHLQKHEGTGGGSPYYSPLPGFTARPSY